MQGWRNRRRAALRRGRDLRRCDAQRYRERERRPSHSRNIADAGCERLRTSAAACSRVRAGGEGRCHFFEATDVTLRSERNAAPETGREALYFSASSWRREQRDADDVVDKIAECDQRLTENGRSTRIGAFRHRTPRRRSDGRHRLIQFGSAHRCRGGIRAKTNKMNLPGIAPGTSRGF